MQVELIFVAGLVLLLGVEPWIYYLLCRYRKRTWRACLIENVTLVGLQGLMPFHQFKDKQMLVEYAVSGQAFSCIINFDRRLLNNVATDQQAFIYVDPTTPSRAFLYSMPDKWRAYLFPLVSMLLFVAALT